MNGIKKRNFLQCVKTFSAGTCQNRRVPVMTERNISYDSPCLVLYFNDDMLGVRSAESLPLCDSCILLIQLKCHRKESILPTKDIRHRVLSQLENFVIENWLK